MFLFANPKTCYFPNFATIVPFLFANPIVGFAKRKGNSQSTFGVSTCRPTCQFFFLHVLTESFPHILLYAAYRLDNNTSFSRMIVKINQLNFRQPTIVIAKALNTYGVQFMRNSLHQKMPRHTDRSFYGHAPAWNCPDPIAGLQAQLLQLRHLTLCKRIMSCIQP